MHNDLVISHKGRQEDLKKLLDKNFQETEREKFIRLSTENDLIGDSEHSEWYIMYLRQIEDIDSLLSNNDPNVEANKDVQKWFDYAQFCLKYNMT